MARIDARLSRSAALRRQPLGHQLMAPQIENQGLLAPASWRATQAVDVPPLGGLEIVAGNREMELQQVHDPSLKRCMILRNCSKPVTARLERFLATRTPLLMG